MYKNCETPLINIFPKSPILMKCICSFYANNRDTVMDVLQLVDPEGVARRQRNVLRRRVYHNKGPNYLIHIDGFDKLKPYGFAIHGAICGLVPRFTPHKKPIRSFLRGSKWQCHPYSQPYSQKSFPHRPFVVISINSDRGFWVGSTDHTY